MWKYLIMLTLWIHLAHGQCGYFIECNTRSVKISDYSQAQFKAVTSNQNVNNFYVHTKYSFNSKLFEIMTLTAQHQNLVYSPISMQVILTFIYAISDGKLHEELRNILDLPNDGSYFNESIQRLISSSIFNSAPAILEMANKLYYNYQFGQVDSDVQYLAFKDFASELEAIDFYDLHKAANSINSWVSNKTHHLIREIISPSSLAPRTNAVLLNSLYFKNEWLKKFSIYDTKMEDFHVNKFTKILVEMMSIEDTFSFGIIDELQTSVLELPYKTSDLRMMLILPHDIDGLSALERKLSFRNLEMLSQQLRPEVVLVKMPKFKIDSDVDMKKGLKNLGLNALFSKDGKINLFKGQQYQISIDQIKHKTHISFDENGTEAATTTFGKLVPYSINHNIKQFVVDHPFLFVIRSKNVILFIGHVVTS